MTPEDLALGTFSDDPPWLVTENPTWRRGTDELRAANRRRLPTLVSRRRLPPLGRLMVTLRHLVPAIALWALGARRKGGETSTADLSRRLRIAAENLGPSYIKLGQIISSGEGLFPEPLVTEFAKCRDQVPAQRWISVARIVTEELGAHPDELFARFDRTPLAAASIAQVHRAELLDGTEVVVKVQREGIDELVSADLEVMSWLAPFLIGRIPVAALANPPVLVETFAETIIEELDFRLEADNMLDVASMFETLDQEGFVVPRPHPEQVTRRIMVMERLSGYGFDDVESMRAAGIDTAKILQTGMVGFLEGALIHGVFHGDLHGGNLFVQPDGRVALLDYGITGRLDQRGRTGFLRLMVAGTMNDAAGQVRALRDLGALPDDTDIDQVVTDLGLDGPPLDPTTFDQAQLVEELGRIVKALLSYGAALPKPLMLFAKNLVFLDGAISKMAPELDLIDEVGRIATYFAGRHGNQIAAQLGMQPDEWERDMDMTSVKASLGVDADTHSLSYAELQERRDLIRRRLGGEKV